MRKLKRTTDSKMNSLLSKKVSFEGNILLGVNFADGLLTSSLVQLGLAVEFNPVMRLLLGYGMPTFLGGKIAIAGAFVLALELLRARGTHVRFIRFWQWVAIIALPSAIVLVNTLSLAYPNPAV